MGIVGRTADGYEVACADVASGAVRQRFVATRWVHFLSFAADGRSIRAVLDHPAGGLERVTWDLATRAELRQPLAWSRGLGVPFAGSPDGELIVFAEPADWPKLNLGPKPVDRLSIRHVGTGQPLGSIGGPALPLHPRVDPIFTPDSRALVVAGQDGRVEVCDVATGQPIRVLNLPFRGMRQLGTHLSPDGRTLAASAIESPRTGVAAWAWGLLGRINPAWNRPSELQLVFVDLATGQVLARLPGSSYAMFSPDGRTVVTGGADSHLAVRHIPPPHAASSQ